MTMGVIIGDDAKIYGVFLSLDGSQVPCCVVAGHLWSNWEVTPMLRHAFASPVYKANMKVDPIVHITFGRLVVFMIYIWGRVCG